MASTTGASQSGELFCQDGSVWLKRYDSKFDELSFEDVDVEAPACDLEASDEGFEVLAPKGRGIYFNGYFQNVLGLYFVSGWHVLQKKKPLRRITGLKPNVNAQALSEIFVIAGSDVLCAGKRVKGADAQTFRVIAHTRFAVDAHALYAWTLTNGLSRREMDTSVLTFVPWLDYCTDGDQVYYQCSWSEDIETRDLDARPSYSSLERAIDQLIRPANLDDEATLGQSSKPC